MKETAVVSFVISAIVVLLCEGVAVARGVDFSICSLQCYRESVLVARAEEMSDLEIKANLTKDWMRSLLANYGFSQGELSQIIENINTEYQSELDVFAQYFVFSRHKDAMLVALADAFPLPIANDNFAERVKRAIRNGMDEQQPVLSYSGEVFNTFYYESQSFYDDISQRIIYVLHEQLCFLKKNRLTNTEQYNISQLFAWAGVARSVIDICKEDRIKEWTIFGEGIPEHSKDALLEFWGETIPVPYRVFMLRKIGQFVWHSGQEKPKNYGLVCHKNPGDLSFLQAVIDTLSQTSEQLYDNLVRFVFDFATSSTFRRGQSAIMEWFCNALAQTYGFRFTLNYGNEACTRKIEDDAKELAQLREEFKDPEFVKIWNIYNSFSLSFNINDLCKRYCTAKEEFRSCSECYSSSYKTILEKNSCTFLLERACSALNNFIFDMDFNSFNVKLKKFLENFPFLIQCSIKKYAEPFITIPSKQPFFFDLNAFKNDALSSLNCFLNGAFLGGELQKLSVFDTWGEILEMAICCLSSSSGGSMVPAFDSSSFTNQLCSEMDRSFLRRLFRHLDVIALETYATNYDDPNVGFELFKRVVSDSNLITLNKP